MRLQGGKPPAWMRRVLDAVSKGFSPEASCGPLGYVWIPPDEYSDEPWKVAVFPTPIEVLGGRNDGAIILPGFRVDLMHVIDSFDNFPQITWRAPSEYTGELDGPCVGFVGKLKKVKLELFIFDEPPNGFKPTVLYDQIKNEIRPIKQQKKKKR